MDLPRRGLLVQGPSRPGAAPLPAMKLRRSSMRRFQNFLWSIDYLVRSRLRDLFIEMLVSLKPESAADEVASPSSATTRVFSIRASKV